MYWDRAFVLRLVFVRTGLCGLDFVLGGSVLVLGLPVAVGTGLCGPICVDWIFAETGLCS
jgi:hypothetical protein